MHITDEKGKESALKSKKDSKLISLKHHCGFARNSDKIAWFA